MWLSGWSGRSHPVNEPGRRKHRNECPQGASRAGSEFRAAGGPDYLRSVDGIFSQYAAPEQFDDAYGSPDDITDIYQFGAVFCELFTGRPPFEGQTFEVVNEIQSERPAPPSEVADVPAVLDEVVLTALATEKADRYEHVLYLRDDLQALQQ